MCSALSTFHSASIWIKRFIYLSKRELLEGCEGWENVEKTLRVTGVKRDTIFPVKDVCQTRARVKKFSFFSQFCTQWDKGKI